MQLIDWLIHIDKQAFGFVQAHLTDTWLDGIMLLVRNPYTWIPLYIYMFYWILKKEKITALKFVCCTILCITITDFSSAHIIKPLFERIRPCYDKETAFMVRGIVGCGGKFSFPSSHASNHFGLAAFWFYSIRLLTGKKWKWLWYWASLISFAQVYVGVHFPLDVAGGAVLGFLTGLALAKIFEYWVNPKLPNQSGNSSLSLP
jgi:membrane-associated phospholipid phosphatase